MDQLAHLKKTDVIKRSIFINGHKTRSLEKEFWQGLRELPAAIAQRKPL